MRPSHLETRYKFDLSPRQREVLELVSRGRTNAEIADQLGITLDGAKYHVREILGKLGVESREEAAAAWRSSRTPSGRIRQLGLGLAGMRGAPMVWAGAASVVVAIVAVVVLVALRQGDSPAALPDATTSAIVGATAEPSPLATTTETAAGTRCTSSNASLRLELLPDGDDVLIQLFAEGAAGCLLLGPGQLSVLRGPPAQGKWDPYVNTERAFKASVEMPVVEPLVVWRWMNQCSGPGPFGWRVELGGLETTVTADVRPSCAAPGSPLVVALERIANARNVQVEGEIGPWAVCDGRTADWLCEFAARTTIRIREEGNLQSVVQDGEPIRYVCTDGGNVQGAEYSTICAGKNAGEIVEGFPLALHGSAGGPRAPADLVSKLQGALDSGDWFLLAAIGCPVDDPECSTMVFAYNTQGAPNVVYLVFELIPGREPAFVGAGISGDNAEDILGGGTTMTRAGEVTFVAIPPPPPGN